MDRHEHEPCAACTADMVREGRIVAERDALSARVVELENALGHAIAMLCPCGGTGHALRDRDTPCGQPACEVARKALAKSKEES